MQRSVLVRRAAPVAVFAAVLAALLVLNAVGGGGGDARSGPRPLPLAAGSRAESARAGGAPGDAAASAPYGGEVVIPDRLLAGQPTKGPAYDVTRGDVSAERLTALARALGVSGEVRSDADGWVVGTGDRVLRVYRQPGTPWYLGPDKAVARPVDVVAGAEPGSEPGGTEPGTANPAPATGAPEPAAEPSEKPVDDGDTPVSSDTEPGCKPAPDGGVCVAPVPCPEPPPGAEPAPCDAPRPAPEETKPPQPSDAQARAAAQRVFDAAGLAGATITLNDAWIGKEVVAAPVVGGLPTAGFETRVTVVADGTVTYGNGWLGGAALAGDYPLLAPRDAVRRGDHGGPRIMIDYACPENEPCPTPEPREATGLRLGLLFLTSYESGDAAYLAPAWLLRFEGSTWEEPALALPDEYVATPPPATDQPGDHTAKPGEVPPDGGDGSTGSGSGAGSTGTEPALVDPSPSGS